ncbi:MAG: ShlB/FhaC/HecB family hemolysin secretion/activation protein [Oligoflexia bacterium]|nr:ShlB/FhaC/HecB family hemolysin secretion/activation protein [Oligoflexia bacterium]
MRINLNLILVLISLIFTSSLAYGQSKLKNVDRLGSEKDFFIYKGNENKQSPLVVEGLQDEEDEKEKEKIEKEERDEKAMSEADEQREYGYITNLKTIAKNENKIYIEKIVLDGVSVFPQEELERVYKDSLKKVYSLIEFKRMLKKITRYYRKNGYMVARAVVPDQKLKDYTVRIQILEGRLDDVILKNDDIDPAPERIFDFVKEQMSHYLVTGQVLNQKLIEHFLVLTNQLSGVVVKTVLSPSTGKAGGVVMTIIIKYQKSFSVDYQVNNHGGTYIGQTLGQLAGKFYHPVIIGDVGANVVKTLSGDGMLYGQIFWQQYLYKTGLKLILTYDKSKTHPTGGKMNQLNLRGESTGWMIGTTMPWLVSFSKLYSLYLRLVEFKGSLMYNSSVTIYDDRIDVLRIGNNFSFYGSPDPTNTVIINAMLNLEYSKGLRFTDKVSTSVSRIGAKRDFDKLNIELNSEANLKTDDPYYTYFLVGGIAVQKSFHSLLSSEEMSFGGQEYGRGYDSGSMSGDSGVTAKMEAHVGRGVDSQVIKKLDLYIFCDAGKLYNVGEITTQIDKLSAISSGAGINMNLFFNMSGSFLVAKPITRDEQNLVNEGKNGRPLRFFLSLGGSF